MHAEEKSMKGIIPGKQNEMMEGGKKTLEKSLATADHWVDQAKDQASGVLNKTYDTAKGILDGGEAAISRAEQAAKKIAKHYPIQTVLGGFGAGILVGWMLKSR